MRDGRNTYARIGGDTNSGVYVQGCVGIGDSHRHSPKVVLAASTTALVSVKDAGASRANDSALK